MPERAARELWDMLPEAYRRADAEQYPPFPLRRWLEGVGVLLARVRETIDVVEAGEFADPAATAAPIWVARILGVDTTGMSPGQARTAAVLRVQGGSVLVGTREHIARAASEVLKSGRVAVFPDDREPFIIYVLADEQTVTNAGGLAKVRADLDRLQAVPAGHIVVPVVAQATWGDFDAAKGTTWADYMALVRTWAQHDSLGVKLGR